MQKKLFPPVFDAMRFKFETEQWSGTLSDSWPFWGEFKAYFGYFQQSHKPWGWSKKDTAYLAWDLLKEWWRNESKKVILKREMSQEQKDAAEAHLMDVIQKQRHLVEEIEAADLEEPASSSARKIEGPKIQDSCILDPSVVEQRSVGVENSIFSPEQERAHEGVQALNLLMTASWLMSAPADHEEDFWDLIRRSQNYILYGNFDAI